MVKYVPYFKYVTLIGVILIIIDFVWSWKVDKDTQKAQALLNKEFNILKAKLFDLQEAAKK